MSLFSDCPTWLDEETWQAYCDWRDEMPKHKRWSPHARKLILKKLAELRDKGEDPTAVLEQSLMIGWTGVFAVRKEKASYQELPASNEARIPAVIKHTEGPSPEEVMAAAARWKDRINEIKRRA